MRCKCGVKLNGSLVAPDGNTSGDYADKYSINYFCEHCGILYRQIASIVEIDSKGNPIVSEDPENIVADLKEETLPEDDPAKDGEPTLPEDEPKKD